VRRLFTISPNVFRPRPKVDSAALLLDFTRPHPTQPQSWDALEQILRAAFGQRRKTLRNALAARFGFETADKLIAAAKVDPRTRAEALAPEIFIALSDASG